MKKALIIFSVLMLFFLLNWLFTKKPGQGECKIILGTFKNLQQIKTERKLSSSFDLYIMEYPEPFKIGADDIHCFNDYLFMEDVNSGDSIKIKLESLSPFRKESITSIISRNREYIDHKRLSE